MEEKRLIALLFAGTLLLGLSVIGVMGLFPAGAFDYSGDLIVESYEVTWQENGDLTERYVYSVRSAQEYRMLYRTGTLPLSLESQNPATLTSALSRDQHRMELSCT
jgi:hypothetical protein